jgi:hypothetical protein
MLKSMTELMGYRMAATDGEIGKAHDFLFDDKEWSVRHLVVDTGRWLLGRLVLIAPQALGEADWESRRFPVSLTKDQIEKSPSADADKPVSRQHEIDLFRYYAWTPYWGGGMMGLYTQPAGVGVPEEAGKQVDQGDAHLRSVRHVKGYYISAHDGEIGHIDDFIVEDETWVIRYVVADTRNWLPGRRVLVSPWWFKNINWADRKASTDLKRADIKNAPRYDPVAPVSREYEERLYDYYGRPKYWTG